MKITSESNFAAEKEVVQTFLSGLAKVERDYNDVIKVQEDEMADLKYEGWTDIVGQTIKSRGEYLKNNDFNTIDTDIKTGSFKEMKANAESLLNELQVCINSKAKIATAEQEMKDATYQEKVNINQGLSYQTGAQGAVYSYQTKYKQPAYNDAKAKKEEGEREFDNGVTNAQAYVEKFPDFHFRAVKSNGNSQGNSPSKRSEVAENFDYDDLREHMYMLFDVGIGPYVPITYGDTTIYLVKMGNDSYALCSTVDTSTSPATGTPINDVRFTQAQVTPQTDNYNGFQHTYPEVEAACVDYFASL